MSWQNQAQFTKQNGFNRQILSTLHSRPHTVNDIQQRQAGADWVKYRLLNQ